MVINVKEEMAQYHIRDEETPLNKLKPNPKNPRKHPERLLKSLETRITTFGKVVPIIVDEDYNIIAGHARHEVALKLGMDTFPVRVFKFTPQLAELFMLADNKIAELSEWDDPMLAVIFEELEYVNADMELTAFDSSEIDVILTQIKGIDQQSPDDFKEYDEDIETTFECPKCGYKWS